MTLGAAVEDLTEAEAQRLVETLVTQSQLAQETLIRATGRQVYSTFLTEGTHLTVEEWATRYVSIVAPAQQEMFQTVIGATAEHYSIATRATVPTPAVTMDTATLVDAAAYEARAAQLVLRSYLIDGVSFNEAATRAARQASILSARQLQDAQRAAGDAWVESDVGKRLRPQHRGWRKVVSASACGWCLVVADQRYREAGLVSSHDGDRCGFAPVVDGDGWQEGRLSGGKWEPVIQRRADPSDATVPLIPIDPSL